MDSSLWYFALFQNLAVNWSFQFTIVSSDRGSSTWDLTAWARDPPDGHQDEDPGGAAPGLPEAHCCAEGEPVRQGGALHYAANRRKFSPLAGKQKGTL